MYQMRDVAATNLAFGNGKWTDSQHHQPQNRRISVETRLSQKGTQRMQISPVEIGAVI